MSRIVAAALAVTLTIGVLDVATRPAAAPAARAAAPAAAAVTVPLEPDVLPMRVRMRASRGAARRPLHHARPRPRPVARTSVSAHVAAPAVASSGGLDWDAVAHCESDGDWHANTGNGYFGGLQMDPPFWRDWHGLVYAPRPDLATRAEQIAVATRAYRVRGREPWPVCGRYL